MLCAVRPVSGERCATRLCDSPTARSRGERGRAPGAADASAAALPDEPVPPVVPRRVGRVRRAREPDARGAPLGQEPADREAHAAEAADCLQHGLARGRCVRYRRRLAA